MCDAVQIALQPSSPATTAMESGEHPGRPSQEPRAHGRPVVRCPAELRLHPALAELKWSGPVEEINEAAEQDAPSVSVPILVTTDAIVLTGISRWQFALLEGRSEIQCIEYTISEEQALHFILAHHKPQRGWNAFVRISLALTLEPILQRRALENMRMGGKSKGSASLPTLDRIDVRQQIAISAAVGARNVSNVKTVLRTAHPNLIAALREGSLSINRAVQLCQLSRAEQCRQLVAHAEEAAIKTVIRRSIAKRASKVVTPDAAAVLETLQQQNASLPGSVAVRVSRLKQTVIFLGRDFLTNPDGNIRWNDQLT